MTRMLLAITLFAALNLTPSSDVCADELNPNNGLSGSLKVTTRRGRDSAQPLELDGKPRFYVEGGTLASATWEFREIGNKTDWPTGIHCVLRCQLARAPYRVIPRGIRSSVRLVHPTKPMESNPIVFFLPFKSPAASITIPHMMEMTDRNQTRLGGLFSDFVVDDQLLLKFTCLDRAHYVALQQRDVTLHAIKIEPASRGAKQPRPKPDQKVAYPFAVAIQACHTTWDDYEKSVHNVPQDAPKEAKIILVTREIELKEQLDSTLTDCLQQLDSASTDPQVMRRRATLHWLLGDEPAGWAIVAELAKHDQLMRSLHLFKQGEQAWNEAQLDDAGTALLESVKLNPQNIDALKLLSLALDGLPDHVKVPEGIDLSKPAPFRRTLPWLTITTIDPAIEELNRILNLP